MAYPAYDTYNQQVAFPVSRRQSMAYGDGYAYDPAHPVAGGVYADVSCLYHCHTPRLTGADLCPAWLCCVCALAHREHAQRRLRYVPPAHSPAAPLTPPPATAYSDGHAYDGRDTYYDETSGYAPWTPGLSRRRRQSSVSMRSRPQLDSFRRVSSTLVKFRRKGGFRSGVSLGEAMANVRLSGNDSYTFHELNVDTRGRIILKVRVRLRFFPHRVRALGLTRVCSGPGTRP